MAKRPPLDALALRRFERSYETAREDSAFRARGDFLHAFPKSRLQNIGIDEYVIGHRSPTFCDYVEPKTRSWANIMGATAFKFGIYFGKTKSDRRITYRFTSKYGNTKRGAFRAVKQALLDLVSLGGRSTLDFAAIDANPLSQLFKAKILSLYYQERFLNICSADHLETIGSQLGYPMGLYSSEYQHLLVEAKLAHPVTRHWSNPKFMMFLYETYIRTRRESEETIKKPDAKSHRRVDMAELQSQWGNIGRAAEEFALNWEKDRLHGADLDHLIPRIEDRRDRPGFGYDFLSHTSARHPRYIEVKSVGRLHNARGYRFFLSDKERSVSRSNVHSAGYYFYLVFFDGSGHPTDLRALPAKELYKQVVIRPASYMVRFDLSPSTKGK